MDNKKCCLIGALVLAGLSLVLLAGCGTQGDNQSKSSKASSTIASTQAATGAWGSGSISAAMPSFEGMTAEGLSETPYQLFCNFSPISQEQYETYVAACKEKGFTIDVSGFSGNSNSFYYASSQDGSLRLSLAYAPNEQRMNLVVNKNQS